MPTAGQWEELAYSGQVPSFCKEAYGLGLGGWVVEPGSSNPQTAGRCPAAHIGEAVGQELLPPDSSSCPLDAAGTSCTCLFTTSSHNSFWEIFTIYSDCWLFIADWKVLGLGVREGLEGRKELGTQHPVPRLWSPPGSPAHPGWEHAELCTRTEPKGDSETPDRTGQQRTASRQPAHLPRACRRLFSSSSTSPPEARAQQTLPSSRTFIPPACPLAFPGSLGPYYLNHCI